MCFIRKSLDYVFTRHELIWLDDIMPEPHKREKADKHKKKLINQDPDAEVCICGKCGQSETVYVAVYSISWRCTFL